jgi:hypothetical protein
MLIIASNIIINGNCPVDTRILVIEVIIEMSRENLMAAT